MTAQAAQDQPTFAPARLLLLGGIGVALAAVAWLAGGAALETWLFSFVVLAGLVVGSLGLLMIGHLMNEEWLRPIRSEAEAAALTTALLPILALPLAFRLPDLYPWASADAIELPHPRAAFLSPIPFLARGGSYLAVWIALGLWLVLTRRPERASAIGLALLAPTATFAANDWVLSREPQWWSSLFGFSFVLSQLLGALAGAILISLLRPEHPTAARMQSLERALLTLALLVLWVWFVHFLIVWLANLPHEAAWYLQRAQAPWFQLLILVAIPALVAAIAILAPPGFGRRTMIAGSALLLIHHAAHMIWLIRPEPSRAYPWSVVLALGLFLAWGALFAAALRTRPHDEAD